MLKCCQRAPGVKRKIESTLSWLGRLKAEGSAVGDEGEQKRRQILFEYVSTTDCERVCILTLNLRALEGTKDQLQSLSEQSNAAGYRENDEDMQAVCALAEDVRDAVIEYQVSPNPSIPPRITG